MQSLYYTPASQSLQLYDGGSDSTLIQVWSDISNVAVTASVYENNGLTFGTTTSGSLRIYAYSGSVSVASFPIESTNLYYPPFPSSISSTATLFTFTSSVIYTDLSYTFLVPTTFTDGQLSGSGCSIISGSSVFVSESYFSNNGGISLISENSHSIKVYSSGSNYATSLIIDDTTYGTNVIDIISINNSSSYIFNPEAYHSYQSTFAITDLSSSILLDWVLEGDYTQSISFSIDDNPTTSNYLTLNGLYNINKSGSLVFPSGSGVISYFYGSTTLPSYISMSIYDLTTSTMLVTSSITSSFNLLIGDTPLQTNHHYILSTSVYY
jgi:hypothetical protein